MRAPADVPDGPARPDRVVYHLHGPWLFGAAALIGGVLERIAASNRPAVVLEDDAQLDMVGTQWLPDLLTALQDLPEVSSVRCAARRLSDRGEPSTGAQLGAACGLQRSNPTHRSMTAQHAAPGMLQMHMSPRGARIVCHTALNMLPGCAPCRDCCAPAGLGLNVP